MSQTTDQANGATTQAVTKTQLAIDSIQSLKEVKTKLDAAVLTHSTGVKSLTAKPKSTTTKESALRGKEKIKADLAELKELRLVQTRKIDALISVFTTEEKKLEALASDLQTYANECVEIELAEERKRQAEAQKELNRKSEILEYKNKVRDYIISEIARVKKEYVQSIIAVQDAHKIEFGNADLVEKLKAAQHGKIKNIPPAFEFKLNPEYDKTEGYKEQYREMTDLLKEFESDMSQMLQDAIIGVPNFVKSLKEGTGKEQLEATEVLMIGEVDAQTEEVIADNKLNDSIQMVEEAPVEIVIDAKKKYHGSIVKKAGVISLVKWYCGTDDFANRALDKMEDLKIGTMLIAAVKEYGRDEKLDLHGIEFSFTNVAK